MDEYKPITGELRGACELAAPKIEIDGTVLFSKVNFNYKQFIDLCDNIDAVHAELERENARLKAERDSMAAALDAAQGEHAYAPESHYMMLPKDADGVPVHVGDWITGRWDAKAKVVAVTSDDVYWWEPDGCHWCHAFEVRHYHAPTVEDVLDGFASAYDLIDGDDEGHQKYLDLIAEYAAKLRLAGEK